MVAIGCNIYNMQRHSNRLTYNLNFPCTDEEGDGNRCGATG